MGRINTVVVCLIFLTSLSFGQVHIVKKIDSEVISTSEIDSIILKLMDTAKVTGLNLAILNDNIVAYIKSYGYKNKETGQFMDTSAIMYAASFGESGFHVFKSFTC